MLRISPHLMENSEPKYKDAQKDSERFHTALRVALIP